MASSLEKGREYWKKHYNKHRDFYIQKNIIKRKELRKWYLEYKTTLKCKNCEENHPACLDFHHKNPKEKRFNVSAYTGGSKNTLLKEIEKCEVLCANCHRKTHKDV